MLYYIYYKHFLKCWYPNSSKVVFSKYDFRIIIELKQNVNQSIIKSYQLLYQCTIHLINDNFYIFNSSTPI